ncbi:hypothetical protein OE88DRAFT_68884 [Heliocybe sulcata]|uniref:Uncharacterized protein n=1 Tax=Heliocybe sulcata TaxID=5364 RepID=A0A5C3NHX4_9AGAM|nr:hypothetical protein OE88DRAFT_68884 [Heliocybe sulcata]
MRRQACVWSFPCIFPDLTAVRAVQVDPAVWPGESGGCSSCFSVHDEVAPSVVYSFSIELCAYFDWMSRTICLSAILQICSLHQYFWSCSSSIHLALLMTPRQSSPPQLQANGCAISHSVVPAARNFVSRELAVEKYRG